MNIDGYCTLGTDREFNLTAEALLCAMDKAEVDRAVIAPVDRCLAVHNREGNEFTLQTATQYPGRFISACSVNPWYGQAAVDELRRSLKAGARLIVLHPFVQGYLANDELLWPLLDALAGSPVPVYVHTGPPGNATPWQVVDLAERYTFLDFIMGHCGATDFWPDVIPAATAARNIYLESSLSRPFQFATYARTLGKHRCIMGSYAPLNELVMEWEHMRRHLPPAEWGDIYGGTLLRLLQKGGAI